jgi:hypothetical protein
MAMETLMVDRPFNLISCGVKLICENTSTSLPEAAIVYCPASLVKVERVLPFTITVTSPRGLLPASVTTPLTVCAKDAKERKRKESNKNSLFRSAIDCHCFFLIQQEVG